MNEYHVSWYNANGYLRTDKCETKRQTDRLERVVATMGGTDFQRGVAGTERPLVKEGI